MRILLTGSSSFTGRWFLGALVDAGHDVLVSMTRGSLESYEGVRRDRVEFAKNTAGAVAWGVRFGDDAFLDLLGGGFDLLCHHGADVTDYKSNDFDVPRALANNTNNARAALERFAEKGGSRLLVTGSVFEGGEGAGSEGLPHFSPYGLSKSLTWQTLAFHAHALGLHAGKFVISNPFGPHEEPRFTNYLMKTWFDGKVAGVRTPAYTRDNIHIDLLARAYARFAGSLPGEPGESRCNPSGYIESQGSFAQRVAREMRERTGKVCELDLAEQTEFDEPRVRINTEPADHTEYGFDEAAAWDAFAEFYSAKYAPEHTP